MAPLNSDFSHYLSLHVLHPSDQHIMHGLTHEQTLEKTTINRGRGNKTIKLTDDGI